MRKPLTLMWVIFAILILYGSLMPFDFHFDKDGMTQNLHRAMQFWPLGKIHSGKADLVSNVILYIPLGFLITLAAKVNRKSSNAAAACVAVIFGCVLSAGIELLQSMSQTRVCGIHDFIMNAAGTIVGSAAACVYGMEAYKFISVKCRKYWRDHPVSLAAVVLGIALAADAMFPFLPTLKLHEVHKNYANSLFDITAGLEMHTVGYWIIQQAGAFAFLCMLTCSAVRRQGRPQILKALVMCMVFAAVLETAKIFISNRSMNIANVVVAAVGCVGGAILFAAFHARASYGAKVFFSAAALFIYMVYLEWGGSDFSAQADMMQRLPKNVEWLPLYDYAMSGRGEKVVLFLRTISISAAFTFTAQLLHASKDYRPKILRWTLIMALLGIFFELGQILLPDRYPTPTDVFCFAVGGTVGSIFTLINPVEHIRKAQAKHRSYTRDELLLYRKHTAPKATADAPPSAKDSRDA